MNFRDASHIAIDGKSVKKIEIGGNVVWSTYIELDYIESTGTQYINTGFVPNQDSRAVVELMMVKISDGAYGSRDTTGIDGFSMRANYERWQPQYNDNMRSITNPLPDNNWHIADQNKNVWSLDGVAKWTATYAEFTSPYPFVIGGILANKSGAMSFYEGYFRFRSCQLYDNGVLVRDLVACKSPTGEIGMYDKLNDVFYGNAGTGEFVAGAEL